MSVQFGKIRTVDEHKLYTVSGKPIYWQPLLRMSLEKIDAVLSRLKDLLDGENHQTRLELARNQIDGTGLNKSFDNSDIHAECCYIRLHMRGHEGAMASAIFDRHLDGATERWQQA